MNNKTNLFLAAFLLLLSVISCKKEDTTAPEIILNGKDTIFLNLDDQWIEPGYLATDNEDGDLTHSVICTGNVNTAAVNLYLIEYKVSDKAGNESLKYRYVYIKSDSLQGNYHVDAVVTGTNEGNYSYSVDVSPGNEYNQLLMKNFCDLGNDVVISLEVNSSGFYIPSQSLLGVNPGYEGSIQGQGTYDGEGKKILDLHFTINYYNGGTDVGDASFSKNW